MRVLFVATFVASTLVVHISADAKNDRVLRPMTGSVEQQDPCILVQNMVQYENRSTSSFWACELSPADSKASGRSTVRIEGLGDDELNNASSGITSLFVKGGIIDSGKLTIPAGAEKTMGIVQKRVLAQNYNEEIEEEDDTPQRRLYLGAVEKRRVLMVRVQAPDSTVDFTLAQLRNSTFGIGGKVVNLCERYKSCSYGEMLMVPYNGSTLSGVRVLDGAYQIDIDTAVIGRLSFGVVDQAWSKLRSIVGKKLYYQFHHVMVCLPPGTVDFNGDADWISSAFVGSFMSVYNNNWCAIPSVLVHGIGHNLNLQHSNEPNEMFGDQTCAMGYIYNSETTRMCFNPAKSAQLGWYSRRATTLDFTRRGAFRGDLIGLADYGNKNSTGKYVYVKIYGAPFGIDDLYVGFNRAAGINSDTAEARDMVTVYQMKASNATISYDSFLLAKIFPGQHFSIDNFRGSSSLIIQVNYLNLLALPPVANVQIYVEGCPPDVCLPGCNSCCVPSDCAIADPCVAVSCSSGICLYDTRYCTDFAAIGGAAVPP